VTLGNKNADAQVFVGAVITGAFGKMTTLTILLLPHEPVPAVPAGVFPQAEVSTYCAWTVWHPGVLGITGEDVNVPPSMLY
jgi:hypothetical protein